VNVEVGLSSCRYRYKFIVDGQWRHAGDLPTELDEWGNINNVVHVGLNGVDLGGGSTQTDIYGARSYGRMYWHTVRTEKHELNVFMRICIVGNGQNVLQAERVCWCNGRGPCL
jgi:hypothetical protein